MGARCYDPHKTGKKPQSGNTFGDPEPAHNQNERLNVDVDNEG